MSARGGSSNDVWSDEHEGTGKMLNCNRSSIGLGIGWFTELVWDMSEQSWLHNVIHSLCAGENKNHPPPQVSHHMP
ncbi:hypothetical protein TNCV_4770501 [Trichonephila clavipes]|nr:hypothetical protein TNCV_4770501 [Trichonephila clavipes]